MNRLNKLNLIFYLGHTLVCFLPTFFLGISAGIIGGLYIEGAQLDIAYNILCNKYGWCAAIKKLIQEYDWIDTLFDLICDGIGIILAVLLNN